MNDENTSTAGTTADAPAPLRALRIVPGFELKLRDTITLSRAGATIQFWIRLDPTSVAGRIFSLDPDKDHRGIVIEQTEFFGLRAYYAGEDGRMHFFQAVNVLPGQGFAHITLTFAPNGEINLYNNGRLVARAVGVRLAAQTLAYNRISRQGGQGSAFEREALPEGKFTKEAVDQLRARGRKLKEEARFSGAMAELRIFGRAFSASEVEKNWLYRRAPKTYLLLRVPLDGVETNLDGHVQWEDAPGLPIQEVPPPPRASVAGRATLVSSQLVAQENEPVDLTQLGGEKLPELFAPKVPLPRFKIGLAAKDAEGRKVPGQSIRIKLDRDAAYIRNEDGKKVMAFALKGEEFTVTTGFTGEALLELPMEKLMTPLFQMRHDGMPAGEWSFFSPDRVIFETFASVTAKELAEGRVLGADSTGGRTPLVHSGAENLADLLHAAMGAALHFSYTEGVALDAPQMALLETLPVGASVDTLEPPGQVKKRTRLQPLPDGDRRATFVVTEGADVDRRVGPTMRKTFAGPITAASAGASGAATFDDVGDVLVDAGEEVYDWLFGKDPFELFGDLVDYVTEGGSALVGELGGMVGAGLRWAPYALEDVVGTVLGDKSILANTFIDDLKVAGAWAAERVEDVVNIVQYVFEVLNKSLHEVLDWLSAVFEWGDFLETSDGMLVILRDAMGVVRTKAPALFDQLAGYVDTLESTLLDGLGDSRSQQVDQAKAMDYETFPEFKPLDLLMDKLTPNLPQLSVDLSFLDPMQSLVTGIPAKLAALIELAASEIAASDLGTVLADPSKIDDMGGEVFLQLVRGVVKIVAAIVRSTLEFGKELVVACVDVLARMLDVRIDIPILTPFVETVVLGGRTLSVGRLLCLVAAIPATITYKGATGADSGFLSSSGALSFADPAKERAVSYAMVKRIIEVVTLVIGVVVDYQLTFADKASKYAKLLFGGLDVVSNVIMAFPGLEAAWAGYDKSAVATTFQTLAWVCTSLPAGVSLLIVAVEKFTGQSLQLPEKPLKIVAGFHGVIGGLCACISDIVGMAESKGSAQAQSGLDFGKDTCLLAVTAVKIVGSKDKVSMAVFGGSYLVASHMSFSAFVMQCIDAPNQLA